MVETLDKVMALPPPHIRVVQINFPSILEHRAIPRIQVQLLHHVKAASTNIPLRTISYPYID